MFEVIAFLYEHYGADSGEKTLPPLQTLQHTLNTLGFRDAEIVTALVWLEELRQAAKAFQTNKGAPLETNWGGQEKSLPSMRLLTSQELDRLGVAGWGFLTHLTFLRALTRSQCELVIERAMASGSHTLTLSDLKLTTLMVLWSLNAQSTALLADLLLSDQAAEHWQ